MKCARAPVNKDTVIAALRAYEAELKSAGVLSFRPFGSVARDEATPDSDVDLMARFDKARCRTLFDYAGIEGICLWGIVPLCRSRHKLKGRLFFQ